LECVTSIIIVLGFILLIAAVVGGVAGVLGNHGLVHSFEVFDYHVTGSDGRLFLYGIVVGAVSTPPNGQPLTTATPVTDSDLTSNGNHRGRLLFGRRSANQGA
jgi:hypothetical protein